MVKGYDTTIVVNSDVHKELMRIKYARRLRSVNAVIFSLLDDDDDGRI
jgi:hypothetical protein